MTYKVRFFIAPIIAANESAIFDVTAITPMNSLGSRSCALNSRDEARMYGRWIRDHKAGVPALAAAIRAHGGNPEDATELKSPVLGTKHEMLMSTHKDHEAAIMTSQMRYSATTDRDIRHLMSKRADTARKHLSEMKKSHNVKNCPMCRDMKR